MPSPADYIAPSARLAIEYTDMLCKEIPDAQFGVVPDGVNCNSPAFNMGHLALYADMAIALLGKPERCKKTDDWDAKYAFGVKSHPDNDGSRYGSKEELLARFRDRQTEAINALAEATPEVLNQTNPNEGMRERFPTVGSMAAFMLVGHPMSHLGQISTWRRCMGMPMIF